MLWLRMEDQWDHDWSWALGCNRNGRLAVMEHGAGIEWILSLGWDLGVGLDLGIDKSAISKIISETAMFIDKCWSSLLDQDAGGLVHP